MYIEIIHIANTIMDTAITDCMTLQFDMCSMNLVTKQYIHTYLFAWLLDVLVPLRNPTIQSWINIVIKLYTVFKTKNKSK